ncbi:dynamin family protein [Spirillospora sp. NPDC029432]|uniref:dynamin family protein n=1 Tax=Spirillospora sp. NPDC029432 TaxID=3154599 RepID=UPI0034530D99
MESSRFVAGGPAEAAAEIERLRRANDALVSRVAAAGELPQGAEGARRAFLDRAELVRRCADEPVTVGVLGVHSTGKTLLLNMLLGRPDLLPSGYAPTTGNVTVLHLRPTDEPGESRLTGARVEFLNETDLAGCLAALYEAVRETARGSGKLDQRALAELDGLLPEGADRFTAEGWAGLLRWFEESGWAAGSTALRLRILELLAFRTACLAGRDVLGREEQVDFATLSASAIKLDTDVLRAAQGPLPPRPGPGLPIRPGARLTEEGLAEGFAFIRRIHLDVLVPTAVWPLGELGAESVSLVDFPGLGSLASKERDAYLADQEIDRLTSIVIMLDAESPYDEAPLGLITRFERTRSAKLAPSCLVVANRLDRLPGGLRAAEGAPDPLHTEAVLGHSDALRTLLGIAEQAVTHGHTDRVTLTSALYARLLAEGDSSPVEVGDAETTLACADGWRRLAQRLNAGEPGRPLGALLGAAAADGGIQRLRDTIARHVGEHGMPLRLDRMTRLIADRVDAQRDLARAVRPEGGRPNGRPTPEQRELRRLLVQVARNARGLLPAVRPQMDQAEGDAGLRAAVEERVVDDVFRWPEWRQLLEAVERGVVPIRQLDRRELRPNDTGELEKSFTAALERLESQIVDLDRTLLDRWIDAREEEAADLRRQISALVQGAPEGDPAVLDWVEPFLSFGWVRQEVERVRAAAPAAPPPSGPPGESEQVQDFPLRREHGLPWHPEYPVPHGWPADELEKRRHQIQVMAVRRELVNALTRKVMLQAERRRRALVDDVRAALGARLESLPQGDYGRLAAEALGVGRRSDEAALGALVESLVQNQGQGDL